MSPDSQCLPAIVQSCSPPKRDRDLRLVAGPVEHRAQIVRHAPVDRDVGADPGDPLDGAHRVDRDAGVPHQRAAGLAQHGHVVRCAAQQCVHVLLDRRRAVLGRVGDPEAAAHVEQRPVAHPGEHLGEPLEPLELEHLRPDVRMQPVQLDVGVAAGVDRAGHVVEPEAELRVLLAGLDVGVRRGRDAGRDAEHRPGSAAAQALDLVERVDHDVADAGARARSRARPGPCCCRACRCAPGGPRPPAPGGARRRWRRRPTGPPRRTAGTRRWRGTPCRRRSPRSARRRARKAST